MVWSFNALGGILGDKVQQEARIETGSVSGAGAHDGVARRPAETAGRTLPTATDQDHNETERRGGDQACESSASPLSSSSSSSEEAEAEVEDDGNGASNLLQVTDQLEHGCRTWPACHESRIHVCIHLVHTELSRSAVPADDCLPDVQTECQDGRIGLAFRNVGQDLVVVGIRPGGAAGQNRSFPYAPPMLSLSLPLSLPSLMNEIPQGFATSSQMEVCTWSSSLVPRLIPPPLPPSPPHGIPQIEMAS